MNFVFIHERVPEADMNAGDLRLWEILTCAKNHGHKVLFIASSCSNDKYISQLKPLVDGVYVFRSLAEGQKSDLKRLVSRFAPDGAVMSPYSTFARFARLLREDAPMIPLILDTVDLYQVRIARAWRSLGEGSEALVREVKLRETNALCLADAVWVVTETEAKLLDGIGKPVSIIPTVHRSAVSLPIFDKTAGIVFIGNYKHSPNVDAILTFHDRVLPLLLERMGAVHVTYAGSNPPGEIKQLASPLVSVPGYVADHRELLMRHRIAIAPLRYGAGMKGKVGDYMACGVPSVLTSIAAEGMRLVNGIHAVIADSPDVFADALARLYKDQVLWEHIQMEAYEHVKKSFSPNSIACSLEAALQESVRYAAYRHSLTGRVSSRLKRMVGLAWKGIDGAVFLGDSPCPLM